jgi:hypothetical protein
MLSKELCHVALPKGIGAEKVCDYLLEPVEKLNIKGGFGARRIDGP